MAEVVSTTGAALRSPASQQPAAAAAVKGTDAEKLQFIEDMTSNVDAVQERVLGEILARYDQVVCPEMNLGQLAMVLRAKYLVDVHSHTQVRGLPFRAAELAAVLQDVIDSTGPEVPS